MDKYLIKSIDIELKEISSEVIVTSDKVKKTDNNFIIYLTRKIDKRINFDLCYLLSDSFNGNTNNITVIKNVDDALLKRINSDFSNIDKKVLLYLGRFPGFGKDIDGGSVLADLLINTLKPRCNLTVNFIRKNKETFYDEQIKHINYFEYKNGTEYKFIRRLKNLDTNHEALKNFAEYDRVVACHTSKLFGMRDCDETFWSKTILFPMFCTSSYRRAGEIVPMEYFDEEKFVIEHVGKIITPSETEAIDLVNDYLVNKNKINVVNRTISQLIKYKIRKHCKKPTNLICIGSIKNQKNNMDQLKLLNLLLRDGFNVNLHLPTTIQDEKLFLEMKNYIRDNNLESHVFFHFSISQKELSNLLIKMDINISTANWETFGCGIFEGIAAGLPTVIFERLNVIKEVVGKNNGVFYAKDVIDMEKHIKKLIENKNIYEEANHSLEVLLPTLSFKKEADSFVSSILDN